MKSPYVNRLIEAAFIGVLMFCTQAAWSQQKDSLQTEESARRKLLLSKPPSGSSEKTVGAVAMVIGGLSSVLGVIRMNEKDPCEGFRGPNVICTSNVEQVRAIGAVQLGVGVGAFIFGIVRYGNGVQKAKAYEEWKKRSKESSSPNP